MDLGTFRAMAGRMPRRNRLARAAWVSLLVACAGAEKASARPDANPGLLADDLARAMADAAARATEQEMDLLLHNPGDDAVLRGPPPAEGCGVITPRFGAALANLAPVHGALRAFVPRVRSPCAVATHRASIGTRDPGYWRGGASAAP